MPILGITASGISGSLNATAFDSIATVTVGSGGASSISFTSIPSTYKHLQIRVMSKTSFTGTGGSLEGFIAFNSDTTSTNYKGHAIYGNGTTASAYVTSFQNGIEYALSTRTAPSDTFGVAVVDILDYTNTNKYKTMRSLGGADINTTNSQVGLWSALWMNTNAITSITMTPYSSNWQQYSSFALYGIKGA